MLAAHGQRRPRAILAADCVYQEELLPPLMRTIEALSDSRTTVLVASERRNEIVHRMFEELAAGAFRVKKLPTGKQHAEAMSEVRPRSRGAAPVRSCARLTAGARVRGETRRVLIRTSSWTSTC